MADLDSLRELCTWMRQENVLYARTGELELRLEPQARPVPDAGGDDAQPATAEAKELAALEEMLHSSGVDPAPFLALMKGAIG